MDTAPTLTASEVIDRVRTARKTEQAAAFEQLELALAWAQLHPCPADEYPAHWGEPNLHEETVTPLAGRALRGWPSSRRPTSAPPWGSPSMPRRR